MATMQERVAIREDLERVARAHGCGRGEAPPEEVYSRDGRYTTHRVRKRSGMHPRWSDTMRAYGLTPQYVRRGPTEREAIEEIMRVVRELGHGLVLPTMEEWGQHGCYDSKTVTKVLAPGRGWNGVAVEVGLGSHAPQLGLIRPRHTNRDLLADYRRIAEEAGFTPGGPGPGRIFFGRFVPYSHQLPAKRFGGWAAFVRAAGYVPQEWKGSALRQVAARAEEERRAAA